MKSTHTILLLLLCTVPAIARADTAVPTIDRLGELQSQLAIAKAEAALAKAKLEAGNPLPDNKPGGQLSSDAYPSIKSIVGNAGHLYAKLVFPDGSVKEVQEGTVLGNFTVSRINTSNAVLTGKLGKPVTLVFE